MNHWINKQTIFIYVIGFILGILIASSSSIFRAIASTATPVPSDVVSVVKIEEVEPNYNGIDCPVDANYSSEDSYATYQGKHDSPDNLQVFVMRSIYRMVDIDLHMIDEGWHTQRRVRYLDPEEMDDTSLHITNAAYEHDNPYATAAALVIIAAYESNFRNDVVGDCRVYDSSGNSIRCSTREELNDRSNYIACGPTQVISNRSQRMPGRPSCSRLMDPSFAYSYTADFVNRFPYESGHWDISGYAGSGHRADRFERKFNYILDILLDETY